MPLRHKHKIGDWLLVDDESGIVNYRSAVVQRWDGLYVRRDQYETRQPQEFVKSKTDPRAVSPIRPAVTVSAAINNIPLFVGKTTVKTPLGPAAHLFDIDSPIRSAGGLASTVAFGSPRVGPIGVGPLLEPPGIASTSAVGSPQVTNVPQGADPGIGDMEIGPTFEVR